MKKKIQLSHRSSCVLVLLLLYFNESIMFREMFSATVRGIFTIACVIAACVFFILKKGAQSCRILLNKGSFQLYLALLVCIGLCILFNGINATFDIYGICIMTVSLLVVNIIDQNVFYQAFVDVMVFLAIASVIIFLGYHILPRSLFDIFPNYYWRGGTTLLKNCYLSVLQVSVQNFRNFGIFYEPGYYAVFLLWALVLALFKQDTEIWKIISLFLALATTLSTGGYIGAVMILLTILFFKNNMSAKKKKKIIGIAVFLVIILIVFFYYNPATYQFLTDKLTEVSVGMSVDSQGEGSGYERWRSLIYALEAFVENPIFGIGYTGWTEKFSGVIGTLTPLNWFGLRGLIYGLLMNFFYLRMAITKKQNGTINWKQSIVLMCILLWAVCSQNMANDFFIFVFVLYQAKSHGIKTRPAIRAGSEMVEV